jgi:hypothetical protein
MKKDFHIYFSIPDRFPDTDLIRGVDEIQAKDLKVVTEQRSMEAWLSLEWAIPGLIVAYLAKPYFEGFLQEMGKDHYESVKAWLKKVLSRARELDTRVISVGEHKTSGKDTQSKAISIFIDLKDGRQLKLLFDSDLTEDDWSNGLQEILEMVMANYEAKTDDQLAEALTPLRGMPYHTVYAYINPETKKWEFIDDLMATRGIEQR